MPARSGAAPKPGLPDGTDPMAHARAEHARQAALTEHPFGRTADELIAKGEKDDLAERTLDKKR